MMRNNIPSVFINIDFGDGNSRSYKIAEEISRSFCFGGTLVLKTMHPENGEFIEAKIRKRRIHVRKKV